MSVCREISSNVSHLVLVELEQASAPCPTWDLVVQNHLLDPFHSKEQRTARALQWLDHIARRAPVFLTQHPQALETLKRMLQEDALTPEQWFYFPYLVQTLAHTDFTPMSISALAIKNLHCAHREYRNEWWTLSGKVGTGAFVLRIWRHTDVPLVLQDAERHAQDYSYLQVAAAWQASESSQWSTETLPVVPEAWGLATLSDRPFGLKWSNRQLTCSKEDTLFPMSLSWPIPGAGGQRLILNLDNHKPLFMMKSNGCLSCSDGVGMKKYTYPDVRGTKTTLSDPDVFEFRGSFEHSWESGVTPEGFASSAPLRTLINMEKAWSNQPNKPDDWLYLMLSLDNGYHVVAYFSPFDASINRTQNPWLCTIVSPRGTVKAPPSPNDVTLAVQWVDDTPYPRNMLLSRKNKDFSLQIFIDTLQTDNPELTQVGRVTGIWRDGKASQSQSHEENGVAVSGAAFVQWQNPGRSVEEALSKFPTASREWEDGQESFLTWTEKHNYFDSMPSKADTKNSFLVWLLPVLTVSVLLIIILFLVWSRRHRQQSHQPWAQAQARISRHKFFSWIL